MSGICEEPETMCPCCGEYYSDYVDILCIRSTWGRCRGCVADDTNYVPTREDFIGDDEQDGNLEEGL